MGRKERVEKNGDHGRRGIGLLLGRRGIGLFLGRRGISLLLRIHCPGNENLGRWRTSLFLLLSFTDELVGDCPL